MCMFEQVADAHVIIIDHFSADSLLCAKIIEVCISSVVQSLLHCVSHFDWPFVLCEPLAPDFL